MTQHKYKNIYLLLSYPKNEDEKLFLISRFRDYFDQSQKNHLLLILCILGLATIHFSLQTSLFKTAIWTLLSLMAATVVIWIDRYKNKNSNIDKNYKILRQLIIFRLCIGVVLATLIGASLFIFPKNISLEWLSLYQMILICIFMVVLASNISFPEYYLCYGFIIMLSFNLSIVGFSRLYSDTFTLVCFFSFPLGYIVIMFKAIEVSKMAINEIILSLLMSEQIKEMGDLQIEIRHQSHHDQLTGLANRRKFDEVASELEASAKSKGSMFGIIYIDIDHFKPINDSYGHYLGDLVLKEIAQRLRNISRESDVVCRMGGDEFCILIKNIINPLDLKEISLVLHERINNPFSINGLDLNLRASLGTAVYPLDGSNVDELVSTADYNMYNQKNRNR